jgi:hypothetical protein
MLVPTQQVWVTSPCGHGGARIVAGFAAGCAHIANAGMAEQITTHENPVAKAPDNLERRSTTMQ